MPNARLFPFEFTVKHLQHQEHWTAKTITKTPTETFDFFSWNDIFIDENDKPKSNEVPTTQPFTIHSDIPKIAITQESKVSWS